MFLYRTFNIRIKNLNLLNSIMRLQIITYLLFSGDPENFLLIVCYMLMLLIFFF